MIKSSFYILWTFLFIFSHSLFVSLYLNDVSFYRGAAAPSAPLVPPSMPTTNPKHQYLMTWERDSTIHYLANCSQHAIWVKDIYNYRYSSINIYETELREYLRNFQMCHLTVWRVLQITHAWQTIPDRGGKRRVTLMKEWLQCCITMSQWKK